MECPQCGQENRDTARFCQYCGALLREAKLPEAEVEIPATEIDTDEPFVEAEVIAEWGDEPEVEPENADRHILDEQTDELDVADIEATQIALEPISLAEIEALQQTLQEADAEPVDLDADLIVEPEWVEEPFDEAMVQDALDEDALDEDAWDDADTGEFEQIEISAPDQEPVEMVEALESIPDDVLEMEMDDLFWREPAETMAELGAGTVINGRYQISEALSTRQDEVLYRVRDLQRCPQCGYDENDPDQAFCESCGAVLDQKPFVLMLARPLDRQDVPVEASVEQQFVEGEFAYWVWQEVPKTGTLVGVAERMRFVVGQKSDVGRQRDLDEDAMFVLTLESTYESLPAQIGLFVVADGMGGHEGGEVASRLVIRTMASELLQKIFAFELLGSTLSAQEVQKAMIAAVQEANEEVYLERQKRDTDMGTTITAVILKEWLAYVAHVGDCRAFHWGENGLQQLTTDHSVVASMIAAGAAAPDEIYTHPQRSVIYRSIGDRPTIEVDVSSHEFSPGDRLIICCDGLWEMIRNEGIEEVLMRQPDPQLACEEMVDLANLAGGVDNISVIVVQL